MLGVGPARRTIPSGKIICDVMAFFWKDLELNLNSMAVLTQPSQLELQQKKEQPRYEDRP